MEDHEACDMFKDNDGTIKRNKAKNYDIDRYIHYYERCAINQSSRLKAMKDLEIWPSMQLKELSEKQSIKENQLQFTVEAWIQISKSSSNVGQACNGHMHTDTTYLSMNKPNDNFRVFARSILGEASLNLFGEASSLC
ncbi:unnamed protein product [Arabidopsis halleri]